MSSGTPDWGKLAAMGKLPKNQRDKVPHLAERFDAEEKVKNLEEALAEAKARISELESAPDISGEPLIGNTESAVNSQPVVDAVTASFPVACDVEGCDYKNVATKEGIARNMIRMHNRAHPEKQASAE